MRIFNLTPKLRNDNIHLNVIKKQNNRLRLGGNKE